jgi:hypothetical protein
VRKVNWSASQRRQEGQNFKKKFIYVRRENLARLLEQEMTRADDEHTARCSAEQKLSAIDKEIMSYKHNHNELIQKYLNENKSVSVVYLTDNQQSIFLIYQT